MYRELQKSSLAETRELLRSTVVLKSRTDRIRRHCRMRKNADLETEAICLDRESSESKITPRLRAELEEVTAVFEKDRVGVVFCFVPFIAN